MIALVGSLVLLLAGAGSGAPASACETWEVEYDVGGTFNIRGTPFGAWDKSTKVGPGRIRLRLHDTGGRPGEGPASLVEFENSMVFDVGEVYSDMKSEAAGKCGVAQGMLAGGALRWQTKIDRYRTYGTLICRAGAFVCGLGGLSYDTPMRRDSTHAQRLNRFVFKSERSFVMSAVEIPNDDAGRTYLSLEGVEVSRRCVPSPRCGR